MKPNKSFNFFNNIINNITKYIQLKKNDEKIIGLLVLLLFFMFIFYIIPGLLFTLFNTLLGNFILLLIILLTYKYYKFYGIIIGIILLIIYRFSHYREKFTQNFTQKSINDFLNIQTTINPNKVFDIEILKQQISQSDLDYFNKNNKWYWNDKVIQLYKEALTKNPYVKVDIDDAVNYARTIYNQNAILQILSQQTKEGQFLLNGIFVKDNKGNKLEELPSGFGDFPYDVDLLQDKRDSVYKCNLNNNEPKLQKITYTGKNNFFQYQGEKIEDVDYNNLENIIPNFRFINKPCNPCNAFKRKPEYSCPFELKLKDDYNISSVMKYLWKL